MNLTFKEIYIKYKQPNSIGTVFDCTKNIAYDLSELTENTTLVKIKKINHVNIIGKVLLNIYVEHV